MRKKPIVLFVCVENSNRSQMAEAFARMHGSDRVEAASSGSHPSGRVNPRAIRFMREKGYDLSTHSSKSLDTFKGREITVAVTMGCGDACPLVRAARLEEWQIPDPKELPDNEFRQVRDLIEEKVKTLLASLNSNGDATCTNGPTQSGQAGPKRLSLFERYLTLWVALCMVAGIVIGRAFPQLAQALRNIEFASGSQINVPIAVLIWLMIIPMMMKIDFSSLAGVTRRPKGLLVTLFVNWLVKPFSMFAFGWLFFQVLFLPIIGEELARQYTAGVIILAAAPCTAMVFVWSYLTDGDPAYTLVQVAVNDLIMLVLFAPIVGLLVGVAGLAVPFNVILLSVAVFIVVPLVIGAASRFLLVRSQGAEWFEKAFLPRFQPVAVTALLATLVFIFAFQAENILNHPVHVALIAVPILIQVYFNSSLAYGLMWVLKVPHNVAAPGALIGASNFFELAVATAIALYGPESGAALATVVGVLVEVPVMLSVCAACNRTRTWFI